MALARGTRLGAYEITDLLGQGGMGEVYRAYDARLKRHVALKVLPSALASSADRLARFEREAQVLASLNHPHIAALYGIEETDGHRALVMELVDGADLALLLARGPLPVPEALAIATQIASALEAAHAAGVIHRDLKPANIRVRPDGTAKVLDFGLAKALEPWSDRVPPVGNNQTVTSPLMTEAGVVLGTAGYMSPEQARGRAVDKRTDIWAFGCVLFEMLTGRRPFAGDTVADTMVAILEREPDWQQLPGTVPERVRWLIGRCLEKELQQRLRDIGDARLELSDGRSSPPRTGAAMPAAPEQHSWRYRRVVVGLCAVLATVLLIALALGRTPRTEAPAVEPPVQLTDFTDSVAMPALSADGRMLTFVRGVDFGRTAPTQGRIYVKLMPTGEPVELTRDDGGGYPTFSPDSSRIVYTVVKPGFQWDSWEVPVLGGAPQPFLPNASGLTWLDEQRLVYSSIDAGSHMGIVTSSPTRTEARSIYFPASRAGMAHRSTPSPDRGSLLVVEMDQGTWQPCRLVPVDGSSAGTPVGPQNGQCTSAAWSPDGRWMYFSSNAGGAYHIWRQRHPDGTPVQLTFGPTEQEGTAITPDGQYLITSMGLHRAAVSWHDSSGERALTEEGFAMVPSQPASGRRLYYLMRTEGSQGQASGELWALDLDTRRRQRLFPGVVMGNYSLSHDGRQVVFTSTGASAGDGVWVADLERRTPPRQLTRNREPRAFFGAPGEIVVMSADGYLRRMRDDGSAQETISPDPIVYLMTVSPDGRWAAVITRAAADGRGTAAEFRSLRGETSLAVCNERCSLGPRSLLYSLPFTWSADGRQLFVDLGLYGGRDSRTVVLPYKSGASLDALWPRGLTLEADVAANPGARVIESDGAIFPAADPTAYLVWRQSFQSNLYRLRLPP